MKNICLIGVCIFLVGCTAISVDEGVSRKVFYDLAGKRNLTNINHIYLGMTYPEVRSIMGEKLNIGYKQDETTFRVLEPITIKSPYRAEVLKTRDKTYHVVYYYTEIKKSDGLISEDELTPLVFEEDKLIGKGSDYLFDLKNKS